MPTTEGSGHVIPRTPKGFLACRRQPLERRQRKWQPRCPGPLQEPVRFREAREQCNLVSLSRPMGHGQIHRRILGAIRAVEDEGYDAAWFGDHIVIPDYAAHISPPPWLHAVSCMLVGAGCTERIRLGSDVLGSPVPQSGRALATDRQRRSAVCRETHPGSRSGLHQGRVRCGRSSPIRRAGRRDR